MNTAFFIRTLVIGFLISLVSACSAVTNNSDPDKSANINANSEGFDSVSITFHGEEYEMIPVALSVDSVYFDKFINKVWIEHVEDLTVQDVFNICTDGKLAQSVSLTTHPYYAFRNAKGKYLTFDNEDDYSDLCLLPSLISNFNEFQRRDTNENPRVGGYAIIKDLCESFNLDFSDMKYLQLNRSDIFMRTSPAELRKWNAPEINKALETHYNSDLKNAVTQLSHAWALYLNGYKDNVDPEYRNQIEKYIFDEHHPEYASFYKDEYSYNYHLYKGKIDGWSNYNEVYPIENERFTTFSGESLPKGTLILTKQ